MLNPNYIVDSTQEIESEFADLEIEILEDVAKRISSFDYLIAGALYKRYKDDAIANSFSKINTIISNKLSIVNPKLKSVISDSAYKSLESDNEVYEKAFINDLIPKFDYDANEFKELIKSGIKATNGEVNNICKSTANQAQTEFIKAIDSVYLSVNSGAFDIDTSVANAIKDLSRKGISYIDYESGTRRRLDTAIRNAVRTGINQTALKCQDKNFDEMGGNLVITSNHAGARLEHAMWQGQIFWKNKRVNGYKNFYDATGYGTGAGLGGWNCRHSYYPFFEGISNNPFDEIDEEWNKEEYELTQEQRYNERMIREWDRRRKICDAAGVDSTKENAKYREWKSRQKQLLDNNPQLKRDYAREKVVLSSKNGKIDISDIRIKGALDPDSKKANKHAEEYYNSVRKMKTDYKKIAKNTGYSEDQINNLKQYMFLEEHKLLTGTKRFDSDFSISQSWQRLIDGKSIQPHDLLLLEHETYERALVMGGVSQIDAHNLTNELYNYVEGCTEYYGKYKKFKK